MKIIHGDNQSASRDHFLELKNQHLAASIDAEVTRLRQDVLALEQGLEAWIAKETALKARETKKETQCMESMYWQKQQVGVGDSDYSHSSVISHLRYPRNTTHKNA